MATRQPDELQQLQVQREKSQQLDKSLEELKSFVHNKEVSLNLQVYLTIALLVLFVVITLMLCSSLVSRRSRRIVTEHRSALSSQEKKQLENKILSLQQQITQQAQEIKELKGEKKGALASNVQDEAIQENQEKKRSFPQSTQTEPTILNLPNPPENKSPNKSPNKSQNQDSTSDEEAENAQSPESEDETTPSNTAPSNSTLDDEEKSKLLMKKTQKQLLKEAEERGIPVSSKLPKKELVNLILLDDSKGFLTDLNSLNPN